MLKTLALVMGSAAIFMIQPANAAVQVGQTAPDFEAVDALTGEAVKLSDLKGQTVVLEWTNHQCPYVIKHYDSGNMQKLQKEASAEDIRWITIVSSAPGKQGNVDEAAAKSIVEEAGAAPSAKILDPSGEIGKAYDAKTTPHMFVIDAEGKLAYQGAIDDNSSPKQEVIPESENYVMAALEDLKAGNPVDPSSTAPYGCSVKY